MARKLPRLQRALDAPTLASVAYGEIASSIYFALGIIALHALGLTPAVLGVVGLLFVLVAFNDFAGFLTGWVLFLDYLIVIALSALFFGHYLGIAIGMHGLAHHPGDVITGCVVIGVIALSRLTRRTRLYTVGIIVPLVDLVTQVLLVVLGFAILFSGSALAHGTSLGKSPSWHEIAFALPLAMLAYTGLETVANYAEEARRPGRDLPRSLFSAIGVVVVLYVLIALVALSAFPAEHGRTALGTTWLRAPIMGVVWALQQHVAHWFGVVLRVYVGLTGALILLAAATTSVSGFGRLAYSLGEHGQLPRAFGQLNRRTVVAPAAVVAATGISAGVLIGTSFLKHEVTFLASLFSFGVLLAFTAAQLAVIRLRMTRPDLRRPFRVPLGVRGIPVPSVIGALATAAVFVVAMVTHRGARYGGPAWLVAGVVVYLFVRRRRGAGLLEHVVAADEQVLPDAAPFSK